MQRLRLSRAVIFLPKKILTVNPAAVVRKSELIIQFCQRQRSVRETADAQCFLTFTGVPFQGKMR